MLPAYSVATARWAATQRRKGAFRDRFASDRARYYYCEARTEYQRMSARAPERLPRRAPEGDFHFVLVYCCKVSLPICPPERFFSLTLRIAQDSVERMPTKPHVFLYSHTFYVARPRISGNRSFPDSFYIRWLIRVLTARTPECKHTFFGISISDGLPSS